MHTAQPGEARQPDTVSKGSLVPSGIRNKLIGLACAVSAALGWGLNWPATKFLLTICPPLATRGVSGLIAGLTLFGVAAAHGQTLVVPRLLWGRLTVAALLNVSAWMGLTTTSLLWLPAGQAATLAYTMPLWATFLAWPMLGERPSLRQVGAIALGICGVVILTRGAASSLDATWTPRIALALSAAGLFAFGTVLSKRMPIAVPHIALTAWQVILGCVPLLGCGLWLESPRLNALPVIGWIAIAYTAVVSMGMCYLLWFAAVRLLKASIAAIGTLLTPVVGVASSSLVLGDPLLLSQVLSLGLVAVGIALTVKE